MSKLEWSSGLPFSSVFSFDLNSCLNPFPLKSFHTFFAEMTVLFLVLNAYSTEHSFFERNLMSQVFK